MKKLKQTYRCMEEKKYGNGKTAGCPTKAFGHDRQRGFTLVELVIVIAIVIILSVVSVPIYRGYIDKAKMSEGYALLGAIVSAQKNYYSEHGNFLGGVIGKTSFHSIFGIDARGNKYFSCFQIAIGDGADFRKHFWAAAFKKDFIISPDECLFMQYNITRGTTISEKDAAYCDRSYY